jgi:hypothetical protein
MTNATVWQVSSAPANRNYANVFLRYGVALIAPGDTGAWSPARSHIFEDDVVQRFAEDAQVGDILLLRNSTSSIHAVGLIASEYLYLPQFDDVNGLDLQHARRVRWFELPSVYDFGEPVFGAISQRFSRVNRDDMIEYAQNFVNSPPDHWKSAPLPTLPDEQPLMEHIPENLQGLVAQVQDLASLYLDEVHFGDLPAEDELLAHYIIPLLSALGWSVEQIGIKWRYVDVSTFRALPRTPENIQFIIEAKRLGVGAEGALKQALKYIETLGIQCDVIVTDGIRYRLFSAKNGFKPTAYANLARLKQTANELFTLMRKS